MLAENIKYLRKKLGLSQEEFGKELGVGQKAVSNWENADHEPSLSTLFEICQKWDLTPNQLLLNQNDEIDSAYVIAKKNAIKFNDNINFISLLENYSIHIKLKIIKQKLRAIKGIEFIEKLAEAWSGNGHRMLILLYYFIESLENNKDKNNHTKEELINQVKNFKLSKKINSKHLFSITNKDKTNLLLWIEQNLDEIDAASILADLPHLKNTIKELIDYPNKALL